MKDLTGKRFGKLVAIKPLESGGDGKGILWLFRCDCGNEKSLRGNHVSYGGIKSCGCLLITPKLTEEDVILNHVVSSYKKDL